MTKVTHHNSNTNHPTLVISTEDQTGTIARTVLVTLLSLLTGASFILVLTGITSENTLPNSVIIAGAVLVTLGVQFFAGAWLTRLLGRRGTWTLNNESIIWQPILGRRSVLNWNEVTAVRMLPISIQIRGRHNDQPTDVSIGSALLSRNEWMSIRSTLVLHLGEHFSELPFDDRTHERTQRWWHDPRFVRLGSLGFTTLMTAFAAVLSIQHDVVWPGVIVGGMIATKLGVWLRSCIIERWIEARHALTLSSG